MELIGIGRRRPEGRSVVGEVAAAHMRAFANDQGAGAVEKHFEHDVVAQMFMRAAVSPLGVPGDSSDVLVISHVLRYVKSLRGSLIGELANRLTAINVSAGPVFVPARDLSRTGGGNAAWVRPADAIPVVSLFVGGVLLQSYKCASITVATTELVKNPAASPIVEQLQREDVIGVVDAALFDGEAGSDARPPSLIAEATAIPSSGDLLSDLSALFASVPKATSPLLLMTRNDYLQCSALNLVSDGAIANVETVVNDNMPSNAPIVFMDGADVYLTLNVDFDISRVQDGAIHMSDPASGLIEQDDLGVAVANSPVMSLWQQNLVGTRVVLPLGWAARPGRVAYIEATVTP